MTAENPEHELKALAVELEKKPGHTPILMRMAQLERDKGSWTTRPDICGRR